MSFTPNFERISQYVSKEDILSKVGDTNIYKRFCSQFPEKLMHCPWRTDNNPSFGFFDVGGKWLWKDMALDESGDVFQFVQKLFATDFKGALNLISSAFNIQAESKSVFQPPTIIKTTSVGSAKAEEERIIIDIPQRRPLNDFDYNVWAKWNWSQGTINMYNVMVADEVWFRKPDADTFVCWGRYTENNPIYFWSHPYTTHVKCYKPFEQNKRRKWLNNCDNYTDVQGYAQCQIKQYPNRPLLLTSSLKEVGFFRTFGFNAMAGHTEGSKFSPDFIRHLYKYCNPILSAYDSDEAGVKAAIFLRKQYNIQPVFVCNANHKAKDPTDLWMEDYRASYRYIQLLNEMIEYYGVTQRAPRGLDITGELHTSN